MPVSGKTSPDDIPFLLSSDIPDMGAGDEAIAERVQEILEEENRQPLAWLKQGTENQIIVCNSSGVPQYVTLGGDATIDEEGTLQLASPTAGTYKTIFQASQATANEMASGVYHFGTGLPANALLNGAQMQGFVVPLIPIVAADYAVAGKTTKLRIRAQVAVPGTAPASKLTFALYGPYGAEGGSGSLILGPAGTIAGSAVDTTPGANAIASIAGADFNLPADGVYGLILTVGSKLANNSRLLLNAQLQMRHV